MVPRMATALCSIVRLVKRGKRLGGQRMADNTNLQLSGCRSIVLD